MSKFVALLGGAVGVCVMAFYMYQSYKLVQILNDEEHPAHDAAVEAVENDDGEDWTDWP